MAVAGKILFEGGASGILFTERREFYPDRNEVYTYWKDLTPWLTWLSQLDVQTVPDPLFKMFQDTPTYQNQYFLVNSSTDTIAANGTESSAFGIDTITGLTLSTSVADDSLINLIVEIWDTTGTTKKGQAFVSDVASTSTVKMKTLKATAITLADNDICRVIGTVRGERSVAGESYYNEISVIWNSTHYFSLPIEVTGKLYDETKLKGYSNEMGRLRENKFKEMKYQVQNAMLKSTSTVGTNLTTADTFTEANLRTTTDSDSNSSAVRTTYGFISILEDYGTTWSGTGAISSNTNIFKFPISTLDFDMFTNMTEVTFDKRENSVIPGFCGYKFLGGIAKKIVDGKKFGFLGQVTMGDMKKNALGWDVRELFTPFGRIQLMPTRMLDNEYGGYCLLPNDQACGIREYKPWQYKTNIKTDNDYNGVKDVINYDAGFWLSLLPTHQIYVAEGV